MPGKDRTVVEISVGSLSEADLEVRRVTGREALSSPFDFEIDFVPANGEPIPLTDLSGEKAVLTWRRVDGAERWVNGIIWSVGMGGVASGKPYYRARLVPKLQRLTCVKRSRIFQGQSGPEIVKKILGDAGVHHRLSLSGKHPAREFCVQLQETDFDFIARILADEGIFFFFEHSSDDHTMVLVDAVSGCAALDGDADVPFRTHELQVNAAEDEHVFRIEHSGRVATGAVSLKDFDFERPALALAGKSQASGPDLVLSWDEYPGGFADVSLGNALSQRRLEELRTPVGGFGGESTCLRFVAGASFQLTEHPVEAFGKKLLLRAVEHQATQQKGSGQQTGIAHDYQNSFAAVDAALAYRPARLPRPRALPTTATVVGGSGEEIDIDKYGRVKVQFHWDREGKKDAKSSCSIRCAQGWAGAGWGATFLPRLGQEVLVKFLEGDPDRPIVVGAVYNGSHPPPLGLPGSKTQSTLRTESSTGGGGSNELLFEDSKGAELLSVHAQRDKKIEVRNDKTQHVGAHEALEVQKDRHIEVHGHQRLQVQGNEGGSIAGKQTLNVQGSRTTSVGQNHTEDVTLKQSVSVAGDRHVLVSSSVDTDVLALGALTVGGAYSVLVAGVLTESVGIKKTAAVAGSREETFAGSHDEEVTKKSEAKVGGDFQIDVKGGVTIETGKDHQETVEGKLELETKNALAWRAKELKLEADKITIVVDGKVALKIDSDNVTFGAAAFTLDGSNIAIKGNSVKKEAAGSASSASTKVTEIKPLEGDSASGAVSLSDQHGKPTANEWIRAELPDGTVKQGRTDGGGGASIPAAKDGDIKVSLPGQHEDAWKSK
jgi:type VI secretion system secreted protein VgrG